MYTFPLPAELLAAAPGVASGLGVILGNLAALIARAFLRNPRHVATIVPLWNYIGRTIRRFARAMAQVDVPRRPGKPRPGRPSGKPPIRFPHKHAWLARALLHDGAGFASQLNHLLSRPESAALLAASPQARRVLRPICHMLGISPEAIRPPTRPRPSSLPSTRVRPARQTATNEGGATAERPRPIEPPCPRLANRWPWVPHPGLRRA